MPLHCSCYGKSSGIQYKLRSTRKYKYRLYGTCILENRTKMKNEKLVSDGWWFWDSSTEG